jgi:hypothetical protein
MKTGFKGVTLVVVGLLVSFLLVALLASTALAQGPVQPGGFGWRGHGAGMMGGWQDMGPGMMGRWGNTLEPSSGVVGTQPYGPNPCPGMGNWGWFGGDQPAGGDRLTLDQAADAVEQYLAAYGDPDLAVAEIMEFTENFYAEVEEQSSEVHAFELLIDPYTGAIHPEPGPNMMWNIKYGHMGGWRIAGTQGPTADMPVSAAQAQEYAQQYLDSYLPGTTANEHADAFYGYYTLHVLQDGEVVGMLSVNGFTGQVWYHNWHGEFIQMTEGHEG